MWLTRGRRGQSIVADCIVSADSSQAGEIAEIGAVVRLKMGAVRITLTHQPAESSSYDIYERRRCFGDLGEDYILSI